MPADISLAVGDGARRMTYAELAEARGISLPSARRLVLRHHWPRQTGNDGIARVTVPLTALARCAETTAFRVTTTALATSHAIDTVSPPAVATTDLGPDPMTVTLSLAVDSLREQLAIANGRADRAERRIDELQDELTRERCRAAALGRKLIEVLTGPRVPWWRRWFR